MQTQSTYCIHSELAYTEREVACGRRPMRLVHGYLCIGHYREQQAAMPEIPRKSRYFQWNDDAVIARILEVDGAAIASGRITEVKCPTGEVLRFLVSA